MISHLKNIARLPSSALLLKKNVETQNAFTKKLFDEILPPFLNENDGSLEKKDLRRMRDYPWQFVAFFADIFAFLRNEPLTTDERKQLTVYASSLCLYDDFFDYESLPDHQIKSIYLNPFDFQPKNTKEKVCAFLLQQLHTLKPLTAEFKNVFLQFYQSQIDSKQQFNNPNLSKTEIKQISFNKGGYALVLARLLMTNAASQHEQETVYHLGAWYQILDDILDIEKDRREKVRTLVTTAQHVKEIEQELHHQTQITFRQLNEMEYPHSAKEKAIHIFQTIGTSGWVHLHRLKQLEKKSNGNFVLQEYASDEIKWVETRPYNYWIGLLHIIQNKSFATVEGQ